MAIDSWDTSEEKLPELGEGQLPPLELSWDVLEEEQSRKNAMKKTESNHEAQNNDAEYIRSEMNRNDETILILKVRHLRRLKNNVSPNPAEFTYIKQKSPSPTHWSAESDHEKEIELKEKLERPVFGKESDEESDKDEFGGNYANDY